MSPPPDVPTLLPPRNQTTDNNRSATATAATAAATSMSPSERLVALSVMTTLIACTIAGNLMVMAFIAYFRHLQTRTNALALSLALADFLVGLLIMPYSTMRSVDRCWPYGGGVFCRVHTWLDFSLTTSSVVHLCCISYDRYVAVADPLRYPQRVTRRAVALLLLCCWLSVPVYSWPIMSGWYSVGVPDGPGAFPGCREVCPVSVNATFGLANMLCAYAAPMLLMSLTYAKIYRLARAQARKIDAATAGLRRLGPADGAADDGDGGRWKAAMRREHNATKTLGVIAGVFVLCWVPYFVLSASDSLLDDATRRAAADISNWLTYVNSTLNPVLVVALNRSFRNAFRATVACRVFAPGFRTADLFNYDGSER
uniref:Histamine H2 receptor-like n=1 Tax=Petromyzon marinus TaxID=7757 RepID=A0A678XEN5_PETMA|nr:histamine H2 receptor-like [Petromyzon marinus]AZK36070.1 trace amine-associated receptor 15153.TAAR369 [Petromyzon marinus]